MSVILIAARAVAASVGTLGRVVGTHPGANADPDRAFEIAKDIMRVFNEHLERGGISHSTEIIAACAFFQTIVTEFADEAEAAVVADRGKAPQA